MMKTTNAIAQFTLVAALIVGAARKSSAQTVIWPNIDGAVPFSNVDSFAGTGVGASNFVTQSVVIDNALQQAASYDLNFLFTVAEVQDANGNPFNADVTQWSNIALQVHDSVAAAEAGQDPALVLTLGRILDVGTYADGTPLQTTQVQGQDQIVTVIDSNGSDFGTPADVSSISNPVTPYINALIPVAGQNAADLNQYLNLTNLGDEVAITIFQETFSSDGSFNVGVNDPLGDNSIVASGLSRTRLNELGSSQRLVARDVPEPPTLGDVNRDGEVDFSDIPAFITVLQSGGFQAEADCDESGAVDFSDIPAFIEILTGQ